MKMRSESSSIVFYWVGYIYMIIFAIICLIPFVLLISASLTSETAIHQYGFGLIPKVFSSAAYERFFHSPEVIVKAYLVSITLTILGSVVGLFSLTMGAYVIQRKDFKYRNRFAFYVYFTSLFSGGLVPYYILMVKYLNLKDSYLALLLPLLMNPFLVLLMRNFLKSIPYSISESAKIDGAGDFRIFLRLILPLSKPGLATIGLFIALNYWNDWQQTALFVSNTKMFPLQYFLYRILNEAEYLRSATISGSISVSADTPTESLKMAAAVLATGPVVLFYPFVQKYFVAGLTVGAVKG